MMMTGDHLGRDDFANSDAGTLGVPDYYARPGSLCDRLARVRTARGTDTDRTYADAYNDVVRNVRRVTLLHRARARFARPAVDRAGARARRAVRGARRADAPTLTGWGL